MATTTKVPDIETYSPRSGRIIGEDGLAYNVVDLLGGGGGTPGPPGLPGPPGPSGVAVIQKITMERSADTEIRILAGSVVQLKNGTAHTFYNSAYINAGNLDDISGSYFTIGTDYSIYLADSGSLLISINPNEPTSVLAPPGTARRIEGFPCRNLPILLLQVVGRR